MTIRTHNYISHVKIDEQLLGKFYNKECTPEEKLIVEKWFADIENSKEINTRLYKTWEYTSPEGNNEILLNNILYKIHYKINTEALNNKSKNNLIIRRMIAAAVVLIILVFVGFWTGRHYTPDTKITYARLYAPYGSRINFNLPDGSRGWLNSGSSLKYPLQFKGNNRKVFLHGEGYFNVKHNPDKPFIVQTNDTRVIALGTSFNVQAYSSKCNDREITLVKGKVVVQKKMADNTYKSVYTMRPGQHIELNSVSDKVIMKNKDTEKYVVWKDGVLMFRNDPLERIVKEMQRFYNVNIEVADPKLYSYHFHATFEDETLFEALRLLKISSGIEYKICKREKNPDGSFKKRKIILYAKK